MNKDELKQYRESIGLTQGELSKALGVANNTVSRWELGQRSIPEFLPLALETIERNLSKVKDESTVGSVDKKTNSTVGSFTSDNETLTFADVVQRLGKSDSSVRRYLQKGRLKGEQIKGEWKILSSDLLEFENSEFYRNLK
jgi:DNA-binding XRE family transcriptional regulator